MQDYFENAVEAAKQLAADVARRRSERERATDTHWNFADDQHCYGGRVTAMCGMRVPAVQITGDPTCPICREAMRAYEAMEL